MTTLTAAPETAGKPLAGIHMIRADIDLSAFQRWAGSRQMIRRKVFDEGFAMHCLLAEMFGELAPKPFRLIAPERQGVTRGTLYGYCRWDGDAMREASQMFSDPLQETVLPPDGIQAKRMPTEWAAGHRLGFETLVRPVARRARKSARPDAEVDVFQREAMLHQPRGMDDDMDHSREEVYTDWLSKQLRRHGCVELESASLQTFRRTRAVRSLRGRPVEGPSALMRGVLRVNDAEAFSRLIERGVGRHRAYGYGMLLLRPPGPAL